MQLSQEDVVNTIPKQANADSDMDSQGKVREANVRPGLTGQIKHHMMTHTHSKEEFEHEKVLPFAHPNDPRILGDPDKMDAMGRELGGW